MDSLSTFLNPPPVWDAELAAENAWAGEFLKTVGGIGLLILVIYLLICWDQWRRLK